MDAPSGSDLRSRYESEGATTERYHNSSFWDARYHQRRFSIICEMLDEVLPSASSFLDVGAGTGEYLAFARDRGVPRVYGADLSFTYCQRERVIAGGVAVVQASGSELPLDTGSIDIVLCSEVLEHLPPAMAARTVHELCRVARRTVLASTPNRQAAVRRLGRAAAAKRVDDLDEEVGHINLMDPDEFRQLLDIDGWTVDRLDARHILPPVVGEVLHLPTALDGLVGAVEERFNGVSGRQGNALFATLDRVSRANGSDQASA
jgi:SAM-dependent methyltransferase